MCAITGFYNIPEAAAKTRAALITMKHRGKESAGIYNGTVTITKTPEELPSSNNELGSNHCLGHVLHAMVGCIAQPIQGKGVLVVNCEIYNWKEIMRQEHLTSKNDTDLLLQLLDTYYPDLNAVLQQLDGVYAFAYERDGVITLCRDTLGVKPLFYSVDKGLVFASEKKAIEDYPGVQELFPRTILTYDLTTGLTLETQRSFFEITPEHETSYDEQRDAVAILLQRAVEKRVPDATFGILLSGGIDSSTIALLLKKYRPHCYVVGKPGAPDIAPAQAIAHQFNLPLQVIEPIIDDELGLIMQTIEDCNPVKVSVAATFWCACKAAQQDGCRVLFSGLGAEDIFAGYERHRMSTAINKECLSGLLKLHERDLYRDDTITMYHGIELRLPFLDRTLIDFSLKIPAAYKIKGNTDKSILRDAAVHLGLPVEIAQRSKKAAQYGSKVMQHIEKLAKHHKKSVARYLGDIYGKKNKKLAVLLSTGKDSVLAMHVMHDMHYTISCCITIESSNPDSFMYHTPNVHLAMLQARALRLPLITAKTTGQKEEELAALRITMATAKEKYGIEGVVVGAIASQYQRERVESIADGLGLTVFCPLWQMDQENELRLLLQKRFSIVIIKVAAEGLDSTWLGQRFDEAMVNKLVQLQKTIGLHPAGEGGEYESLVLDAPLFKERLVLLDTETIKDGPAATLLIKHAELQQK